MNNLTILAFALVVIGLIPPTGNCIKLEISEATEKSDMIFVGTVTGVDRLPKGDLYEFKVYEQFKKTEKHLAPLVFYSKDLDAPALLVIGEQYLIFGVKENLFWINTSCEMRTVPLSEASYDLNYLKKHMTCENPNPEVFEGCSRDFTPVCGCNGITYDNACEAFYAGVTWWIPGTCR